MRWGTKLRWLKPLNGRWNRNRHPSLEYRTRPNLRPANRKNPASIFSVKFNWLRIVWRLDKFNYVESVSSKHSKIHPVISCQRTCIIIRHIQNLKY
jgi:hypothetical protein